MHGAIHIWVVCGSEKNLRVEGATAAVIQSQRGAQGDGNTRSKHASTKKRPRLHASMQDKELKVGKQGGRGGKRRESSCADLG